MSRLVTQIDCRRIPEPLTAVYMQSEGVENRRLLRRTPGVLPALRIARYEFLMPCGYLYVLASMEDIPLVDTPCPCGNPEHWLVKWDE